jgi:hypothetical protein
LKNTVQINTGKTTLGCTKNGSERFSDENFTPQRTVQNGSVSVTVQNGSELFAFFGTFYKERFRTVSWHMSWGCVLAYVFSISKF